MNYNFDRFDLPNKWVEADFEKLADICEECKKARREKAAEVCNAFIFQVSKDIGSMACVLKGKVDQIVVTGGIAYDKNVKEIKAIS